MRTSLFFLLALPLIAADSSVQYWTANDMKQATVELSKKLNEQKAAAKNLSDFGGYYTLLSHREGTGTSELHAKESDIFVAVSGEATLVTGGTIVNPKTEKPGEIRGTDIKGGQSKKLLVGDIVNIPANVPHQLKLGSGKEFTYFVLKVREK